MSSGLSLFSPVANAPKLSDLKSSRNARMNIDPDVSPTKADDESTPITNLLTSRPKAASSRRPRTNLPTFSPTSSNSITSKADNDIAPPPHQHGQDPTDYEDDFDF